MANAYSVSGDISDDEGFAATWEYMDTSRGPPICTVFQSSLRSKI
eukprot:CAMPEP_0201885706 /NCGR_PEP_ID=MMETSP0902-20130614/19833_1 /ASSEMBLY_ACC=CAM_ASM_000551 /TAXON_ID=420261 /ORGANISM="Thalassiosira antarctica, Strain CCMP982" /LENGTH=44 /DNA_ID= /DNA_START= /DNA_END= /DNA_ORIENTATION=